MPTVESPERKPKISGVPPPTKGHRRTVSTDIIERAKLELIVPHATDLDILDYLNESSKPSSTLDAPSDTSRSSSKSPTRRSEGIPALASVAQRLNLFYDEEVPVYIALQITGIQDDAVYESYSNRLSVSLEVTAIEGHGARTTTDGGSRPKDSVVLLYQKTIRDQDSPRISWKSGDTRLAIWKTTVPLGHPKVKTLNPRVVFSASATLKFMNQIRILPEDEYITSRQTLGINLLETFGAANTYSDPSQKPPYLSAARVSRVTPATPAPKETFSPLGYTSKKSFPIVPALNFKLRGSKLSSTKVPDMIACLHLEVTPHAGCDVRIDDIALQYPDGKARLITESETLELPVLLYNMDEIMILFSLQPPINSRYTTPAQSSASLLKHITVKLRGEAMMSDTCHPIISTHWDTTIDFSSSSQPPPPRNTHHNPSLRPPTTKPGSRPVTPVPAQISQQPQQSSTTDASGLSITFTGPSRVHVGEIFSWQVFVVNRGSRNRKLALVVPPRRRRVEGKNLPSLPQNMTEPVMDEMTLYTMCKAQYMEPTDLISLVNDVKIGPLATNACHNAELRFIALTTGVLTMECVRVVDLLTNDITDCRDLPSIICINKY